jgi:hypothetical protein
MVSFPPLPSKKTKGVTVVAVLLVPGFLFRWVSLAIGGIMPLEKAASQLRFRSEIAYVFSSNSDVVGSPVWVAARINNNACRK